MLTILLIYVTQNSVQINIDLLETLHRRQIIGSKSASERNDESGKNRQLRCVCKIDNFGTAPQHLSSCSSSEPSTSSSSSLSSSSAVATIAVQQPSEVFRCLACHFWCHRACIYQFLEPSEYDFDNLLCHICYQLEQPEEGLETSTADTTARSTSSSVDDSLATLTDPTNASSVVVDNESFLKRKAVLSSVAVGDLVDYEGLVGIITDIEDDYGRLHMKGTKRDKDFWVELSSCSVLEAPKKKLSVINTSNGDNENIHNSGEKDESSSSSSSSSGVASNDFRNDEVNIILLPQSLK